MNNLKTFTLVAFPDRDRPSMEITGYCSRDIDNIFHIFYHITGELKSLDIPPLKSDRQRQDRLWEKTCLEFFLGLPDQSNYWEFNLSPDGDWNSYNLTDYRQGLSKEEHIHKLPFEIESTLDRFSLSLSLNLTPIIPPTTIIKIGVTTVIKTIDNQISYWALTHQGNEPDFHLKNSFLIEI